MKALLFFASLFLGLNAYATVIHGEEAQTKYEQMQKDMTLNPGTIGMTENLFFGSDNHPELGKLKMTYFYETANSNLACWKEDYVDAGQIFYGCSVN